MKRIAPRLPRHGSDQPPSSAAPHSSLLPHLPTFPIAVRPPNRIPVLYIGGMGRAGSTVLSAALGGVPSFLPVGELRGIWVAVKTDELCGCGSRFRQCRFWQDVGRLAFGGWENVDPDILLAADSKFCRHRSVPRLASPRLLAQTAALFDYYLESIEALYHATHAVSGGEAIILDSTKDAPYAFVLRRIPTIDLRLIHLVRDSRAVAFSWSRQVPRPEYAHIPELRGSSMDRMSPTGVAIHWGARNALFHWLSGSDSDSVLVKYESFVAHPAETISHIARWYNVDVGQHLMSLLSDGKYESLAHHTIGGNRVRFAYGANSLQLDDEWVSVMPRLRRLLVTLITLPLLRHYGYPLGVVHDPSNSSHAHREA